MSDREDSFVDASAGISTPNTNLKMENPMKHEDLSELGSRGSGSRDSKAKRSVDRDNKLDQITALLLNQMEDSKKNESYYEQKTTGA